MSTNSNKWELKAGSKLGLALSGGGFRASLFHIGVLARLAELDLLRHVQVLSTVSGGSIIGAAYYLKVKQLLENRRPDKRAPSPEAYVTIVREIEKDFLEGVQQNPRMSALLDPLKNAMMLLNDDYSRSDRMAELYQQHFYMKTWLEMYPDHKGDIRLKDIKITPTGCERGFGVREYNKTEDHKIPILALNATTLNTGAPWVFAASYVGLANDLGDNAGRPYSRLWFDDGSLPPKVRDKLDTINLADAVAASACVPVLFTPLAIHDLYTEDGKEVVVELVDGGVYDNQGMETLFSENCTHIICSDAAGQLQSQRTPNSAAAGVATRSNDILMERVRGELIEELDYREKTGTIQEHAFWHLRDKFPETAHFPCFSGPNDRSDGKSNGEIYLLSALRTDLDAFSDIEACALMYDGYCLCDSKISGGAGLAGGPPSGWGFLRVRELVRNNPAKLIKHLNVGSNRAFKVFHLLGYAGLLLAVLLVLALLALVWVVAGTGIYQSVLEICELLKSPGSLISVIVLGLLSWALPKLTHTPGLKFVLDLIRGWRSGKALGLIYPVAVLGAVGSLVAFIHTKVFDRLFLKLGKL
jgi:NTE family protein